MRRFFPLICVVMGFIFFFATTSACANNNIVGLIDIICIDENGAEHYVLRDSTGTYLHDPIPYEIVEFSCYYDKSIGSFIERFEYFSESDQRMHRALYVSSTGYFSGFIFWEVSAFHNGLAAVSLLGTETYGYIDIYGQVVIPIQWAGAEPFYGEYAEVYYITETGYHSLWIDSKGNVVAIGE